MTTKPPLQKILQGILHTKSESKENQERTGSTKPQEKKMQESRMLCALRYDKFWKRFHESLCRMYIVQKLDEIFCGRQLGAFDLWCDLVLEFLY
jgi:hypothetical protein